MELNGTTNLMIGGKMKDSKSVNKVLQIEPKLHQE